MSRSLIHRIVLCVLTVAGALYRPAAARASTITEVSATDPTTQVGNSGDGSISISLPGDSASITVSPEPTITATVTGATTGIHLPESTAFISYTFTVSGPSSSVLLDIDSFSTITTTGDFLGEPLPTYYQADTSGIVDYGAGDVEYFGFKQICSPSDQCQAVENAANDIAIPVVTGMPNTLVMSATDSLYGSGGIVAEMGDLIELDPSVTDPQDYTITLSENVGNSPNMGISPSTVPEPRGWPVMVAGLGLMIPIARRRSRRTSAQ